MNYETAKAIAAEVAPKLLIDPPHRDHPMLMVARARENGPPFSITLSNALPGSFQDIPAREAIPEQPAIEPSDDHPGQPHIPAQPAVAARTEAGQIAESERAGLIASLDTAKKMLGVE